MYKCRRRTSLTKMAGMKAAKPATTLRDPSKGLMNHPLAVEFVTE